MAKGQKRSNRELRKPKQGKAPPKPESTFGNQIELVDDLDGATAAARLLPQTLDMPQRPDSMKITDGNGKMHYSGIIGSEAVNEERQ